LPSRRLSNERFTDLIVTDPESGTLRLRSYTFQVVEGPDRGKFVKTDRGSVVVGSAPDADLVLTDSAVSRAHCRLVPFGDGVELTDLESKNGVYVGGMRVMHARVAPGTEFTIGRSTIRVDPDDRDAVVEPSERTSFENLRGSSRAMRTLFTVLEMAAKSDAAVLIEGEHGVGKMRTARAIHQASTRAQDPLLAIDARIAKGGAWTQDLERATGTAVIGSIDELAKAEQIALLKTLEAKALPCRLISTTQRDLKMLSASGGFDRSLLLRIGVVRVKVPPLRDRAADLPLLSADILTELGHKSFELGPADLGRMQAYAWPDNVAELRTVIERAVSLEGASLQEPAEEGPAPPKPHKDAVVGADLPYKQARAQMIEAFEREYVRGLLDRHEGNVSKAARAAGIDRVYLHRLLRKYNL
jgi:DNA-binding NtrC family response regulator